MSDDKKSKSARRRENVQKGFPMHEGVYEKPAEDEKVEERPDGPAVSPARPAKTAKAKPAPTVITYVRGPGGSLIER